LIKQIDDDKANVTRVVEELSHQIHRLEEQIVIRAENKQHWDIEQTDKEDSNKRIADLALEIDKRITELARPDQRAEDSPGAGLVAVGSGESM